MKCLNCNNEVKDTEKYCGICGTPNPNFIGTVEDNSSIKLIKDNPEAAYNPLPVAPLQSPDAEPEENGREQDEETPQKEKRTAPLWLCILCIVIIFILSIICGVLIQLHFGTPQAIMNFAERILIW